MVTSAMIRSGCSDLASRPPHDLAVARPTYTGSFEHGAEPFANYHMIVRDQNGERFYSTLIRKSEMRLDDPLLPGLTLVVPSFEL